MLHCLVEKLTVTCFSLMVNCGVFQNVSMGLGYLSKNTCKFDILLLACLGLFLMLEEELHNVIVSSPPEGITKPGRCVLLIDFVDRDKR